MVCNQLLGFAIHCWGRKNSVIQVVHFRCSNSFKNNFVMEMFKFLWELKLCLSFLEMAKLFLYFQIELSYFQKKKSTVFRINYIEKTG